MQLTKLDRWLKERFIYETHIFTLRIPDDGLPHGVVVQPVEENKGGDYRHRLIIKDNKLATAVIALLRKAHIMHATHIIEGKNWYNKHICPKKGASFTYKWIFRCLSSSFVAAVAFGVYRLTQNVALMNSIRSTIEELKGGL